MRSQREAVNLITCSNTLINGFLCVCFILGGVQVEARAYDQFGSFDSFDEGMLGPEEEGPDEKVQAPSHPFLIVEITIQSCVKSLLDDVLSEGLSRPLWPLVCADPELSNPRLIPSPEQVFSYLTSDGVFQIREPVKTGPGGMSGATPRRRPRLQQVPTMI